MTIRKLPVLIGLPYYLINSLQIKGTEFLNEVGG
jgi:hypothetical protein